MTPSTGQGRPPSLGRGRHIGARRPHSRDDRAPHGSYNSGMISTQAMISAPSGRGMTAVQRGAAAEALAADYLVSHGATLLARNLRCRAGELDIVCLDRDVLAFVEVRQRTRADFGGASASVTRRKRDRLLRAAAFHWQRHPGWQARILRFDVITVQSRRGGGAELVWIKDAFRAG